jgi:hypothetical protein
VKLIVSCKLGVLGWLNHLVITDLSYRSAVFKFRILGSGWSLESFATHKYSMPSSEPFRAQFLMNVVRWRLYEIVQTDSKVLEESEVTVKDIQRNFDKRVVSCLFSFRNRISNLEMYSYFNDHCKDHPSPPSLTTTTHHPPPTTQSFPSFVFFLHLWEFRVSVCIGKRLWNSAAINSSPVF